MPRMYMTLALANFHSLFHVFISLIGGLYYDFLSMSLLVSVFLSQLRWWHIDSTLVAW